MRSSTGRSPPISLRGPAISSIGGTISPTKTPARLSPPTMKYGPQSSSTSTGFTLNALYDTRDNSINPYNGFYAMATYRDNLEFMGSNSNWESLIMDVRKYFKFPAGSRNILAFWSYDWLILKGKPPYLDLPSTNWDTYSSTGRGYIQGRFRGDEMVDFESEYRFPVTANGFLGAVVFVNGEILFRPELPPPAIRPTRLGHRPSDQTQQNLPDQPGHRLRLWRTRLQWPLRQYRRALVIQNGPEGCQPEDRRGRSHSRLYYRRRIYVA